MTGRPCEGGGEPLPFDPDGCGECVRYRLVTPGLFGACASVAIERGTDAGTLMREALEAYHRGGHEDGSGR